MFENVALNIKFSPVFASENQAQKFIDVHKKKFENWLKAYRKNQNPELEFVIYPRLDFYKGEYHVGFSFDIKNIGGLGYPSFSFLARLAYDLDSDTLENSYLIKSINFVVED